MWGFLLKPFYTFCRKNGDTWLASLFYKANEKIDAGVEVTKGAGGGGRGAENPEGGEQDGGGDVIVNLGMIYHLEEEALIRAKINNVVELGLGYEQKLREGITASISAVLDCNNFKDGNHRLGVGVALQC